MASQETPVSSPYDTPLSSGLRFLVEITAWVAGPWAAAQRSVLLAVPVFIVLVGVPAVFSTTGDKKQVIVATPGPIRVGIELVLHGVAAAAAWSVWPTWLAVLVTFVVVASLLAGVPRMMWLLRGAPLGD
jgi:hypothetical protein